MSPKYKLTYFDTAGAAEPIRYIFAYANQEYEDIRIKPADWPFFKSKTPFGKLPVLEIDGNLIAQSNAIARYLARQFGLTGKNEWESLQCDVLVDTLLDFVQNIYKMYYETDLERKENLKKQLKEKDIPFYLNKFDEIVAQNSMKFLVGSQVTWTDLAFAAHLGILELGNPQILKPYPAIDGLVKKIHDLPAIKTWLTRRPNLPESSIFEL